MTTPYSRVVALNPATGEERWAFKLPSGNPSTRGLGTGRVTRHAAANRLRVERREAVSIDAASGKPNPAFGGSGVVALDTPECCAACPAATA